MKQVNLFIAGLSATLVMTILLYVGPFMGSPHLDIAALLGSLLGHGTPAAMTGRWWAGLIWHALNGVFILPLIYSNFVYGRLPGADWLRGATWGLILWVAMGVVFQPITGQGLFGDRVNPLVFFSMVFSFVLNVLYGTVFGAIAGAQIEHPHGVSHPA